MANRLQSTIEGSRELKQRARRLLPSCPLASSDSFPYSPGPFVQALPAEDWALARPSAIKKMPQRYAYRPI